jgi:hypothetical protein
MKDDLFSCGFLCKSERFVLLATCFLLVPCLAYFLTLKMEAACSSEMSVNVQRAIRHYISEGISS